MPIEHGVVNWKSTPPSILAAGLMSEFLKIFREEFDWHIVVSDQEMLAAEAEMLEVSMLIIVIFQILIFFFFLLSVIRRQVRQCN